MGHYSFKITAPEGVEVPTPTDSPSPSPTETPAMTPTPIPTIAPTQSPTDAPTSTPVRTAAPTQSPIAGPSTLTPAPATAKPEATEKPAGRENIALTNANAKVVGHLITNDEEWTSTDKATENSDGSITFTTSALYSGGGLDFYFNEDRSPFRDIDEYSKVIVAVSATSVTPLVLELVTNGNTEYVWGVGEAAAVTKYIDLEGGTLWYEFDLSNISIPQDTDQGEECAIDRVRVKYNGYNQAEGEAAQKALRKTITVHSIELIRREGGTPTAKPTLQPTQRPEGTSAPTLTPTQAPMVTTDPADQPTQRPEETSAPTLTPTHVPMATTDPADQPTQTPGGAGVPTMNPGGMPTGTPAPVIKPTERPKETGLPAVQPTRQPDLPQSVLPSGQGGSIGKVSSLKVKVKGRKATVSWKRVSGVSGYQICYSTSKKFSGKKLKASKRNKVVLKRLKKKTWYFRVRAFKGSGINKAYGKWSRVKRVKVH